MIQFEPSIELLQYILRGDAVMFVGAGVSAEMGYPSWRQQLDAVAQKLKISGVHYDEAEFMHVVNSEGIDAGYYYLSKQKGVDKKRIAQCVKEVTVAKCPDNDSIYHKITRWPISCYITTNFDDELHSNLAKVPGKDRYVCVGNSPKAMSLMSSSADGLVFKIHGTYDDPERMIITSVDYSACQSADDWKYYRDSLDEIFRTRNVIIIGYSLGDSDIRQLLERIKLNVSPSRKIYAFLTGVSNFKVAEFEDRYNVKIMRYPNEDGRHAFLGKILAMYDQFITSKKITIDPSPDSDKAMSLYILRHLSEGRKNIDIGNYLLLNLNASTGEYKPLESLLHVKSETLGDIDAPLQQLRDKGLVEISVMGIRRTELGDKTILAAKDKYEGYKTAAFDLFMTDLGLSLSSKEEDMVRQLAINLVEEIFCSHGMSLASSIFADEPIGGDDMMGVFKKISEAVSNLDDPEKKLHFVQSVRRFLLQPASVQREYMTYLAQGYFTYHLLRKDPHCVASIKEAISQDCWFVDSNVLQPLCAVGCPEHAFVNELFELLKQAHTNLFTTERVLLEIKEHLGWATRHEPTSREFLAVDRIQANSAEYNFFRHGYVRSMINGEVKSYHEYFNRIAMVGGEDFHKILSRFNIKIVAIDERSCRADLDSAIKQIESIRKNNGTYRDNGLQVPAEAELYLLMIDMRRKAEMLHAGRRIYFLSSSSIFNQTDVRFKRWTCNGLFRYVRLLPNQDGDDCKTMIECLRSEFFNIGFNIIDEGRYNKYFKTDINYAKLKYPEELELLRLTFADGSDNSDVAVGKAYEATPDYEKPIFVARLGSMIDSVAKKNFETLRRERDDAIKAVTGKNEEIATLKRELEEMRQQSLRPSEELSAVTTPKKQSNRKRRMFTQKIKQKAAIRRKRKGH